MDAKTSGCKAGEKWGTYVVVKYLPQIIFYPKGEKCNLTMEKPARYLLKEMVRGHTSKSHTRREDAVRTERQVCDIPGT